MHKFCYHCGNQIGEESEYKKFYNNWSTVEVYDCGCKQRRVDEEMRKKYDENDKMKAEFRNKYNAVDIDIDTVDLGDYLKDVEYLIDFRKDGCNCCGCFYYVVCKMKNGQNQAYEIFNNEPCNNLGPLINNKKFADAYTDTV
jgi:hypothetical protein